MAMGPRARHCRQVGCRCTHEDPCDRGWRDRLDDRGNTVGTAPCPTCRPELAGAVLLAEDREDLRRNLAAHRAGVRVEPEPVRDPYLAGV
jgi:hypothetical protein